jgi:DNA-binding NarL/FixJ family response regulator
MSQLTNRDQAIVTLTRKGLSDQEIAEQVPPYFTQRELSIIPFMKQGITSKEIGEKLFISHRTVEIHRGNIIRKLGISYHRLILEQLNKVI